MSGTRYPTGDGPAADDDARYRAVLRRGRELRRRRRLGTAGAGVLGCVALLAVGLALVGSGGGTDRSVTAGPTGTAAPSSTLPPTFTVSAEPSTEGGSTALVVDARDPAQPDSPDAVLCVLVRVGPAGQPAVSEGRACAFPGDSGVVTAPLAASGGVEIGCAGTATPTAPPAGATRDVTHRFRFDVTGPFPPGAYPVKVTAVSGVGDGCTPADPGESLATTDTTLTVG
ncbi:MAG: hypothetical protein ACOYOP_01240 [Microthrixaceae bacterium]